MQPLSVFNMSIQCKGYAHGMKVAMFRVASEENPDRFLLVPTRPKTCCKQGSKQCKQRRILKRLHRLQIRTGSNLLKIPPFFSLKSRCLGSSSSGAASSYLYFPWRSRSLLTSQVKIPPVETHGNHPLNLASSAGTAARKSKSEAKTEYLHCQHHVRLTGVQQQLLPKPGPKTNQKRQSKMFIPNGSNGYIVYNMVNRCMENPCFPLELQTPRSLSAPVKLDIRKGLAWDQRTDVILGLWLVSLFSKRRKKVLKRFPGNKKISKLHHWGNFESMLSSCFPRHFQSPWGSRWWGLWTCIHHVEVCFLTLHLFGIFGWISIVIIIVVRSRHLTVAMVVGETTGLHLFLGDQVMSSGAIEFCWRRSSVKNTYCVGSKIIRMWGQGVIQVGNARNCFCHRNHAWNRSKGMCWNGKLWWFLDVFFRFGRNFRAGETRKRISSRRPAHSAACCLKGQEVSRVTTQETSQIAPRLNFFANPHIKDFSRNPPIVKPIPFPILIGVVFGNGGLTIGGVLEKSLAICQTSCELMLPSIHPNSSIRIRHSQGPTCAFLARKMQVCRR